MTDELIGSQLGQYHIIELVRRGGMATVYKAHQPSLDRYVAVKVLFHNRDPQFAARFKREARAIAQLQHPNILPIYDNGEQDGLLYLVLQYVEQGVTLSDKMGVPFDPVVAFRLIGRLLDALEYAHVRGIVHRDIKPANVLMPSPSWPMLTDFGIAKLVNDNSLQLTTPGLVVGTATYMAPEQATGRQVNARTDIYATGVILYEMLTGRVPFDADTPMAVLTQHLYEAPPPMSRLNPGLLPVVEATVLRALAKDPSDRYQSAAEMAAALERVASQLQQGESQSRVTGLYYAGVQAFAEGQWDRAIEHLDKLVAIDPDYEDSADLLAAAREARERAREEARRQIDQVRLRHSTQHQPMQSPRVSGTAPPISGVSPDAPPAPVTGETTRFQVDELYSSGAPATKETHRLPAVPDTAATSRLNDQPQARTTGAPLAGAAATIVPGAGAAAGPKAEPTPSIGSATPGAARPQRRSGLFIVLGVVVAVGVLIAGLWLAGVFGGRSTANTAPTGAPIVVTNPTAAPANNVIPTESASAPTAAPLDIAIPAPAGKLVFEDEFSDGGKQSGLEDLVNDTVFQRGYHPDKGEVYHLKLLQGNDRRAVYLPRKAYADFNVQIEMWDFSDEMRGTAAQGVIFRVRDPNHYYAFMVDPRAGRYTVRKFDGPGQWSDLIPWKASALVKRNKEHNVVRVDGAGDSFTIYLNDKQLDTFSDGAYASGMLGMIVENVDAAQPHMHFDNLKVWSTDPAPAAAAQPSNRSTPTGEMKLIPGGEFIMGANEEPDGQPHMVNVPDFYIDSTEVTNAAYAECVSAKKCTVQKSLGSQTHPSYATDQQFAQFPVIHVSWQQATAFCGWAGKRLPTEAEWEKAASWNAEAQQKTAWPWGNDDPKPDQLNSAEAGLIDTTSVAKYPPGVNGLYDMAGNVYEWTSSIYKDYPYNATDGREDPNAPDDRVYRGGSWGQSKGKARSSVRQASTPVYDDREIGFRCAVAP
jgi:formylglycine-generating enzyme required for sulfatase activity/tetratricopeptide (TPR) repeat protein